MTVIDRYKDVSPEVFRQSYQYGHGGNNPIRDEANELLVVKLQLKRRHDR